MKNDNYITVFGWMFNELELNPNKAAVFGLIYGFSQDGVSVYKGSLSYISNTLNLSRNTVISILKSLEKNELIIKKSIGKSPVMYNEYSANLLQIKGGAKIALPSAKIGLGVVQKLTKGSAKIAPNNNIYNTNKESGARALDFFKKESPIQFEEWLIQYKSTIKNFVKFIQDFNDKFDEEGKDYTVKIIKARASRFARNWAEVERKDSSNDNATDVAKIKWS